MSGPSVRVFSLFRSIQGESTRQGRICAFVRLAGCPFRCSYCDTIAARQGHGEEMSIGNVVEKVRSFDSGLVEITGGEPLAQAGAPALLSALADAGFEVLLETSGALPIRGLDPRVRLVLDLKTPGSGMAERVHLPNYDYLDAERHEVKVVVTDRADFEWALGFLRKRGIEGRVETLFSPARGLVEPADLASWMMESGCRGRLQLQLQRVLWPDDGEEK
jgi:7-carboxy-7-deazaguanine synthase